MSQTHSAMPTPVQQKAFFQFATGLSAVVLVVAVAVAGYNNENPLERLVKFGIVPLGLRVAAHRAGREL
jgi:hypothetical protein